jgi:hypothetical protein
MSSLDFIIDNIRFSYSSLTTYETCPYSFKLTYIDKLQREDNFYGQYGTLVHNTMYEYFAGNLDSFELSGYFKDNYNSIMLAIPPSYPMGMEDRYKEAGLTFFDNFSFNKSLYDIILNEEKIEFDFEEGIQFVAKPDLVLYEKSTGKFLLYDYKTSAPFRIDKRNGNETVDMKKINGYYKQMYIYTYALRNYKFTPIDEIVLWFTRPDRQVNIPWSEEDENEAIKWLHKTVDKIKKDEKFKYNNENEYFCNNLCSVRIYCEYCIGCIGNRDIG